MRLSNWEDSSGFQNICTCIFLSIYQKTLLDKIVSRKASFSLFSSPLTSPSCLISPGNLPSPSHRTHHRINRKSSLIVVDICSSVICEFWNWHQCIKNDVDIFQLDLIADNIASGFSCLNVEIKLLESREETSFCHPRENFLFSCCIDILDKQNPLISSLSENALRSLWQFQIERNWTKFSNISRKPGPELIFVDSCEKSHLLQFSTRSNQHTGGGFGFLG